VPGQSQGFPALTTADVEKVWSLSQSILSSLPGKIHWQELLFTEDVAPRSYPASVVITRAGIDPFAESWELLVKFHPAKAGRDAFSSPLALPSDWWKSFESAFSWRKLHVELFSSATLSPKQLVILKSAVLDRNPIIRKLAVQKLLRYPAEYTTEDILAWVRSETKMQDVAIALQMVLDSNRDQQVFADMEWLFKGGEELKFGALLGFSLKFVDSQNAVDSLKRHQWLQAEQGGTLLPVPDVVQNQSGYIYLKRLSENLVAHGAVKTAPFRSFVATLFRVTHIYYPPAIELAASRRPVSPTTPHSN
jgi:hypothetical protein